MGILNYLYGNAISIFLSFSILNILLFYVTRIQFERSLSNNYFIEHFYPQLLNQGDESAFIAKNYQLNRLARLLLPALFLTILFISSLFTLKRVMSPGNKFPYFLNTDYHTISQTGIAFTDHLSLVKLDKDSTTNSSASSVDLRYTHDNCKLVFNSFFTPTFEVIGKHARPINDIFPVQIDHQFSLHDASSALNWQIEQLNEDQVKYTIDLKCADSELLKEFNLSSPFEDKIVVQDDYLNRGKSLYTILIANTQFTSNKVESKQLLEAILLRMGSGHLLRHYDAQEKAQGLSFFPSSKFIEEGFNFQVQGKNIPVRQNIEFSLNKQTYFFIGFNQQQHKMCVADLNPSQFNIQQGNLQHALYFDYPSKYSLKDWNDKNEVNKQFLRFITNDPDEVIESNLQAGYKFDQLEFASNGKISGYLQYYADKPNKPLRLNYIDNNQQQKVFKPTDLKFSLKHDQADIYSLFELRNFYDHLLNYNHILVYGAVLYLMFLCILIFRPGKGTDRIEYILFATLFTLLIYRFILWWRVATFPPIDHISKHELENTLIKFEFNLFGSVYLPIPITLLWVGIACILIYLYRTDFVHKKWQHAYSTALVFLSKFKPLIIYSVYLFSCFVLFLIGKYAHAEVLVRTFSIFFPLAGYFVISYLYGHENSNLIDNQSSSNSNLLYKLKGFIYHGSKSQIILFSCMTIAFFLLTDKGFGVLFLLFLLLKTILISFLRKSFNSSLNGFKQMLLKPINSWVYGVIALAVYLLFIYFKPLFYYLVEYKLLTILFGLVILSLIIFVSKAKQILKKAVFTFLGIYLICISIPVVRQGMNDIIQHKIKHVVYRASIIHQSIDELIAENAYGSFAEKKIMETAENQWFMNSYVSKPYDANKTINLRPHFKGGVDFTTQTRDVISARYIIGEQGNWVMYLILLLLLIPLIIFLLSFQFVEQEKIIKSTYIGLVALIMLFTITLFVWLTSTNRFVFFGQDLPFLSLTSKLSVLLPLMLLCIPLFFKAPAIRSRQLNLKIGLTRYLVFFGLIALTALTTLLPNELAKERFSIVIERSQTIINEKLNTILSTIQDDLVGMSGRKKYSYAQLIDQLKVSSDFRQLMDTSDIYTSSLLRRLVDKPFLASRPESPLYIRYDQHRYISTYNRHLYLELPPYETSKVWKGNILSSQIESGERKTMLQINQSNLVQDAPFIHKDLSGGFEIAVLPATWFLSARKDKVLMSIKNTSIHSNNGFVLFDPSVDQAEVRLADALVNEVKIGQFVQVKVGDESYLVSPQDLSSSILAKSIQLNGKDKLAYPLKEKFFWLYHFGNAVKTAYANSDSLKKNIVLSFDYALTQQSANIISQRYQSQDNKSRRFKFAVIAADGDGEVRLMLDHVNNRRELDPNDEKSIYALAQEHFFFSDTRNERDQWGNTNLMNLYLGPGSSVKPLVASAVSSQAHLEWDQLNMQAALGQSINTENSIDAYGGLKLKRPWKNSHGDALAASTNLSEYLARSSNYYQSIMMFLGSYSKNSFQKNGKLSLLNLLQTKASVNNLFPRLELGGKLYYLPSYQKKAWPKSTIASSYFGLEESLLANGFALNFNLLVKDQDKNDHSILTTNRVNYTDSMIYHSLQSKQSSSYFWSFPEESYFLQLNRAHKEIQENFNIGLKNSTLGGYPYQVSPFKMAEMYGALASQNRQYRLHITGQPKKYLPWYIDSSWTKDQYKQFLSAQIFKGMHDVIYAANGTFKELRSFCDQYPQYYFYAKTGTIDEEDDEESVDSKRLALIISDRSLHDGLSNGKANFYVIYFTLDHAKNHDTNLYTSILNQILHSASFTNYIQQE